MMQRGYNVNIEVVHTETPMLVPQYFPEAHTHREITEVFSMHFSSDEFGKLMSTLREIEAQRGIEARRIREDIK